LPFCRYCIFDTLERLVENQGHRSPMRRKSAERASVMPVDPLLQILARCSDVVGAIRASKDVEVRTHTARRRTRTIRPSGGFYMFLK
jgi:hypothetical protein